MVCGVQASGISQIKARQRFVLYEQLAHVEACISEAKELFLNWQ